MQSMFRVSESPLDLEMLVMFISLFSGTLMSMPPRPRMCVLCILTRLTWLGPPVRSPLTRPSVAGALRF